MNIWILTIGSSDVQLKPQNNWTKLYRAGRSQLKPDPHCNPSKLPDSDRLRVPARVMGVIYSQPEAKLDELAFPLIDNFINKLKVQKINIDKVVLILSDQSVLNQGDLKQSDPYWQDTCTLQPILEKYLTDQLKDETTNLNIQTLYLKAPAREKGLDDWNAVLKLVQDEFSSLEFPDNATIYVSHQAGTPAISSAVQFTSLSRFGRQVKFLVSNERDSKLTRVLESSEYLKGIRKREALTLLDRHDYSGVEALVRDYLKDNEDLRVLLNAAMQWNFAKFDEFANEIQKLSSPECQDLVEEAKERSQQWWWSGYEAAYLAFIRLEQKNAVEAFFHSFRAVEGLISKWSEIHFPDHIDPNNDSPRLKASILEISEINYFGKSKYADRKEELIRDGSVILSGFPLYALLRSAKPNWKKDCKEITEFIEKIAPTRNKVFHRLRGLEIDDVFEAWLIDKTKSVEEKILILDDKVTKYLNFVSEQTFKPLKEASLMAKVHRELERAIAAL